MLRAIHVALVSALLLVPFEAAAQEAPASVYVMGGVNVSSQPGLTGTAYVSETVAPGGVTLGWALTTGAFVSRAVSLEAELSSTGLMVANEPSRYDDTYKEERRERFLGGNVRFHWQRHRNLHLEPLAGFAVSDHDASTTIAFCEACGTPFARTVVQPRWHIPNLPRTFSVTGGVDLRVGGRHLAVVPALRLRTRLSGDDAFSSYYPGSGLPRLTFSAGISGRIDL